MTRLNETHCDEKEACVELKAPGKIRSNAYFKGMGKEVTPKFYETNSEDILQEFKTQSSPFYSYFSFHKYFSSTACKI